MAREFDSHNSPQLILPLLCMSNVNKIEWLGEIPSQEEPRGQSLLAIHLDDSMEFTNEAMDEAVQLFSEASPGFEKTAQQRSFMQWLHEKANAPRHMAEAFSGNYQEQMRLLRDVDDSIRRMAGNIKASFSLARKALKQRKYLDIVHFVGNVNDDLRSIVNERHLLKGALNHHLEDFYGNHEHADLEREYFRKNAGIMDWFQDSSRRKAGKLFEKMYENVLKERKRAMNQLVDELAVLVEYTFETLKDLGTHRARGDFGAYVGDLDKLAKKRDVFEVKFKHAYDTYIKPMIDRMKQDQKDKEESFGGKEEAPQAEAVPLTNRKPGRGEIPDLEVPSRPSQPVSEPEATVPMEAGQSLPEFNPGASKKHFDDMADKAFQNVSVQAPAAQNEPQAIELVTDDVPSAPEPEYKIPEAFMKAPPKVPYVEVDTENGRPIPGSAKRKFMGAEELIVGILKSGMDVESIKNTLLAYSEDFDDEGDVEASLMCLAIAEGEEYTEDHYIRREEPITEEQKEAYQKIIDDYNADYETEQKFDNDNGKNEALYQKIMNNDFVVNTDEVFTLNEMRNELLHNLTQQNRKPTDEEKKFIERVDKAWAQEDNRRYGKMSEEQLEDAVLRGAMRDANRNNELGNWDFHPSIKGLSKEDLEKKYKVPQIHYDNDNGSWHIKVNDGRNTDPHLVGEGTSKKDALVSAMAYYWS